jgi:hypothetical protein
VTSTTLAGFRHAVFGSWFNVLGVVFTVLMCLGLLPLAPAGLMGMLGVVWVAGASLLLAFGRAPSPSSSA